MRTLPPQMHISNLFFFLWGGEVGGKGPHRFCETCDIVWLLGFPSPAYDFRFESEIVRMVREPPRPPYEFRFESEIVRGNSGTFWTPLTISGVNLQSQVWSGAPGGSRTPLTFPIKSEIVRGDWRDAGGHQPPLTILDSNGKSQEDLEVSGRLPPHLTISDLNLKS